MARFALIAQIALRQLRSHPRRFVVTVTAAALCVAVAVTALSMIAGARSAYTGRLLEVGAHLTVKAVDVRGRRTDLLLDVGPATGAVELGRTAERADRLRLRNVMTVLRSVERTLGDELEAASPYLSTQVLATYGTNEGVLTLKGIMPERESRLVGLDRAMESGSVKRLGATRFGILLGRGAAVALGAGTGDRIRIVSMTGDIFNVEVVGVYDLGVDAANRDGLVNLRLAQTIERALPSEASAIALQLRHPSRAAAAARRIERASRREVETWEETYPGADSPFGALRIVLFAIAAIALTVAGFAISSTMIAATHEGRGEAATLRSIGMTARAVLLAYLLQGAVIALVACAAGSIVAALSMALLTTLPGGGILPLEGATLPIEWSARWFAIACAGMLVAGIAGALVPARSAARRRAAAVLRSGA